MLKPGKFVRRQFPVEAVQVTLENFFEVAEWCGGEVLGGPPSDLDLHVQVKVFGNHTERQSRAFIGDWVLKMDRSFKVYTDKSFRKCFASTPGVKIGNG